MKLFLISIVFLLSSVHDFHSSVTQIDHNKEAKALQITVRLFSDDLSAALVKDGAPKMELGTASEPPEANELIAAYLQKHLVLKVNGKLAAFNYLGKEAQLDATWCYMEVEKVGNVRKLEIQNTLLLDDFEDQTNLVNLNIKGTKKSGISRNGAEILRFEF